MFTDNFGFDSWILSLVALALLFLLLGIWIYLDRRLRNKKQRKLAEQQALEVTEPWPGNLPPLEEFARQVLESTGIPSTLFMPDPALQPHEPTATWIGKVVAGLGGWLGDSGVPTGAKASAV